MGTRNLTMVINKGGETKVAQYGQWDGYPSGQGLTILEFLLEEGNIEKLTKALEKARFLDPEGKDKEFYDDYCANAPEWSSDPDNRTQEQKHWWRYYMHRDLGGDILTSIINSEDRSEILLGDRSAFVNSSLFCEYAYVVDLKNETFEVYEGFNKTPLDKDERFYNSEPDEDGYFPCKLLKKYDLNDLPTKDDLLKLEEEEEEAV